MKKKAQANNRGIKETKKNKSCFLSLRVFQFLSLSLTHYCLSFLTRPSSLVLSRVRVFSRSLRSLVRIAESREKKRET